MNERLLHIALRTPWEGQPGLAKALRSIASDYQEIDWQREGKNFPIKLLEIAIRFNPTIVFAQLQCKDALTPKHIKTLRNVCNKDAVLISWDGDIRGEPDSPSRKWFVELGKELDISLITNTGQLDGYRKQGIRCDYLQIGIDHEIYKIVEPIPGVPRIVTLASKYETHKRRNDLIQKLAKRYGSDFAAYGAGWEGTSFGRPMLTQYQEAQVYNSAEIAISMSIRNDLAHYSSDRLFRALASGGHVIAEYFPGFHDLAGNTTSFLEFDDLCKKIDFYLSDGKYASKEFRKKTSEAAHKQHSWLARMPELQQIVAEVRSRR